MFKQTERCQSSRTFVIGDIIHHQDDATGRILPHQQFFREGDEGRRVLGDRRRPGHRILQPVVTAKEMPTLLATRFGRRNAFLLTRFHPASTQRRFQAQRRFVHKDEFEIVGDGLFLSSANNSAA